MYKYPYILVDVVNQALKKHSLEELIASYKMAHDDLILETLSIDYHFDFEKNCFL